MEIATLDVRIHSVLRRSRANGPGIRYVIWFQGCTLRCPGCFNPETHSRAGGHIESVDRLADDIAAVSGEIEGITISGGEPLEQMDGLLGLLRAVRARTQLSVVLFTGFDYDEVLAVQHSEELLSLVDVLIAGRYDERQATGRGLVGSSNQTVHFLTDTYSQRDLDAVPEAEIIIAPDGSVIRSGVRPALISATGYDAPGDAEARNS